MNFVTQACVLLALVIASSGKGQKPGPQSPADSITWTISNLERQGDHPIILGSPQVIETPYGKAELFDGNRDGIFVNTNPLAGAKTFTVEAIFRPDLGGSSEQRWLHIQEETGDNRILLEIRLSGTLWFLDTFIKSGDKNRTLYAENFKHAVGEWHHVALVYDGNTMRHYVDGKAELSGALSIAPLARGKSSIGVRMNQVYWFKGAILKVRFTQRALSPQQFMEK